MLLVAGLINFGVKNQVPKVSFIIIVGESVSIFSYKFDDIIFFGYLDILEEISYFMSDSFTLIDMQLP